MPGRTSPRLEELFALEGLVLRKNFQQDKRAALLAVARMFDDFQVLYVISGGLAVQLYSVDPRHTNDVGVVTVRERFRHLSKVQPYDRYGFELVFDRGRFIKLRHTASNVEVDINTDTRFSRLLSEPTHELVENLTIPFVGPLQVAFAKLRTQRSDWPRDPFKRDQIAWISDG